MKKNALLFLLLIATFSTVSAQKKLAGAWKAVKFILVPNDLELDMEKDELKLGGFMGILLNTTDSTTPQMKKARLDSLKKEFFGPMKGLVFIFEKDGKSYLQTETSFSKGSYSVGKADDAGSYRLEIKEGEVLSQYDVAPVEGSKDRISFTMVKNGDDEEMEELEAMMGGGKSTIILVRASAQEEKELKKGLEAHQKKVEQLAKEKAAKAEQ